MQQSWSSAVRELQDLAALLRPCNDTAKLQGMLQRLAIDVQEGGAPAPDVLQRVDEHITAMLAEDPLTHLLSGIRGLRSRSTAA